MASNDERRIGRPCVTWELLRDVLGLPADTELLATEPSSDPRDLTLIVRQKAISVVPDGGDIPNVMAKLSKKPLFDGWVQFNRTLPN